MSSQKVLSLKKATNVTYSADGSILVDKEKSIREKCDGESDQASQYNQLIVPRGKKHTQLQLADGSVLHINSGSRVVYPRSFFLENGEKYLLMEKYI